MVFWGKTLNYKGGTSKNHRHYGTELNFLVPNVWPFSQLCMTNVRANAQ